jgi:hypothetical protein
MDPFSIGVGCASLIQMIIVSSISISSFVKSSRHARHELEQVDKQLRELKFILDIFQDDVRPHEAALTVVESHRDAIFDLFNTAREAIEGVDLLIREHDGVLGPGLWALTGKTKVQNLTRTLEASIGRLKDVMDAVTRYDLMHS